MTIHKLLVRNVWDSVSLKEEKEGFVHLVTSYVPKDGEAGGCEVERGEMWLESLKW